MKSLATNYPTSGFTFVNYYLKVTLSNSRLMLTLKILCRKKRKKSRKSKNKYFFLN